MRKDFLSSIAEILIKYLNYFSFLYFPFSFEIMLIYIYTYIQKVFLLFYF